MSEAGQTGAAGRAKRATRACNHCRWKRLKCSDQAEGESCMNCRIYGTTCEYTTKWPTQPGKRKERSDSLLKARKKHKSYSDLKESSDANLAPGAYSPSSQSPEMAQMESLTAEIEAESRVDVMDSTDVTLMETVDLEKKHHQDQDPGYVLVNDKLGRKLIHYLTPMMTGIHEDEVITVIAEDVRLPPQAVTEVLIDAFFDHVGPIYPIIDQTEFRAELHQYYQSLVNTDRLWLLQAKLMMCVGAVAVRDQTDLPQDIKELRETIFNQVMSTAYLIYCHGKARNIQILILITLYCIQTKKLQGAWLWCRWGIRMQRHYIFRRERPQLLNETQDTQQLRDILTWALFIIESQLSLISFHDDPRLTEAMIRQPTEEMKDAHPIFCHRLALARMSHKVSGVYLESTPDPLTFCKHIEEMYNAIGVWKDELPSKYRPESRIFSEEAEYKHVLLMHVEFHTLHLTMFTALGAISRVLTAGKSSHNHPSAIVRNQIAVRITNSRRLLSTIGAMADASEIKPCVSSWMSLTQILNPFSFIYGHILRRPALSSVSSDLELLLKATEHFSSFTLESPRNKHILSLLTAMYKAAVEAVAQAVMDKPNEHDHDHDQSVVMTPTTATMPRESYPGTTSSSYPHSLNVTPIPGDGEYDYSPTIPTASSQQVMMDQNHFGSHAQSHSGFAFPPPMDHNGHPLQHPGHTPFHNEEDAAAWLASQNQGHLPHLSMMGSQWDEWWWQGNGGGTSGPWTGQ